MLARVPGWPFSADPLIAEAKLRARRRRWLSFLVLVVVAVVAATALELRSGSGSGFAAVGTRPVIHFVTEDPPTTVVVNLKTGRGKTETYRSESWNDRRTGQNHAISIEHRRLIGEELWTNHYTPTSEAAAVTHFYTIVATGLRPALKSGSARIVGRGTFDGHHLDWLQVRQTSLPRWRHNHPWWQAAEAVGVDARTFRPVLVRFRFPSGKRYEYTRILTADTIPYNPADFKRRGPKHIRLGGAGCSASRHACEPASGYAAGSAGASSPSTVVRRPWLTAGTSVAGLKLLAVRPFTIRRSKHHFTYGARNPRLLHGLELVYGPPSQPAAPTLPSVINLYGPQRQSSRSTRLTTVYEVRRAPRVTPWAAVPANSVQLQTGLTTSGNDVVPTLRIGYLRKHGLFLTIRTPEGQRAALKIARSLH
jgi:hypothetical protein